MKILVCGDRNWTGYDKIKEVLSQYPGAIIVHGACRGADTNASLAAVELGLEARPYPARWNLYGRAAGPIRNTQMLDEESPDLVLAFHDDLSKSKGTADMIQKARKRGIGVGIHTTDEFLRYCVICGKAFYTKRPDSVLCRVWDNSPCAEKLYEETHDEDGEPLYEEEW